VAAIRRTSTFTVLGEPSRTRDTLSSRLAGTGLLLERWTTDPEDLFASALLRRA